MGCDIHMFVEKTLGQRYDWWASQQVYSSEDYEEAAQLDIPRNYFLFSWLAGVRNYEGESGKITPISTPRGMPLRLSTGVDHARAKWDADGHSESYFTLAELKEQKTWQYQDSVRDSIHSFLNFIIPLMEYIKYNGQDDTSVRIVFWFDN